MSEKKNSIRLGPIFQLAPSPSFLIIALVRGIKELRESFRELEEMSSFGRKWKKKIAICINMCFSHITHAMTLVFTHTFIKYHGNATIIYLLTHG